MAAVAACVFDNAVGRYLHSQEKSNTVRLQRLNRRAFKPVYYMSGLRNYIMQKFCPPAKFAVFRTTTATANDSCHRSGPRPHRRAKTALGPRK